MNSVTHILWEALYRVLKTLDAPKQVPVPLLDQRNASHSRNFTLKTTTAFVTENTRQNISQCIGKPKSNNQQNLQRMHGIRISWLNKKSSWQCYRLSSPAAAVGCPVDFPVAAVGFSFLGPVETLTIAGRTSRSPRRKPRRSSWLTKPSLNSWDSSRAMASCTYIKKKENPNVKNDRTRCTMLMSLIPEWN